PNCWARRPGTVRAKAVPCTLQTRRPAIWERTRSYAAAPALPLVPRFRPGVGMFLRRRRARPGCAVRRDEPRPTFQTSSDLRLREQSLYGIYALLGNHGR